MEGPLPKPVLLSRAVRLEALEVQVEGPLPKPVILSQSVRLAAPEFRPVLLSRARRLAVLRQLFTWAAIPLTSSSSSWKEVHPKICSVRWAS